MANTTITPTAGAILALGLAMTTMTYTNYSWAALGNGATGATTPNITGWQQAKFKVSGTLGPSGTAIVQGSNDATNFVNLFEVDDLTNPGRPQYSSPTGGLTIAPAASGVVTMSLTEQTSSFKYLRAITTGGDGTTAISINAQVSTVGAI